MLVHGQGMQWEDYARVLPDLAQRYHVFAVDCFGHGESSHDPALYSCEAIGRAFKSFAAQKIGACYLVSGHSSGGIIAAWLAANDAEQVTACVLEDPPFFRVTPVEMQQEPGCFAWKDGFMVTHAFLRQGDVADPTVYYAQHSYLFSLFGGLQPKIAEWTAQERSANPDAHLTLAWVPHDWVRGLYFYDDFDVRFSETFYDGTWFDGIDQADLLRCITCPAVYLKAKTNYGEDGTLLAANSDEDAARVQQLVAVCETVVVESGHDIHYENVRGRRRPGGIGRIGEVAAFDGGFFGHRGVGRGRAAFPLRRRYRSAGRRVALRVAPMRAIGRANTSQAFAAVDQMASKYSCPSCSAASYSSRACAMSSVTRPSMP